MGYYTTWSGKITIDPPIPWSEMADSPYRDEDNGNDTDAEIVTNSQYDKATDTFTRRGVAIQNRWEDHSKSYDMVENVQAIVDTFGEGRTFSGCIEADGEEAGDQWRLYVRNGKAVRVKPLILWPVEEEFVLDEGYEDGDMIMDGKGNFFTYSDNGPEDKEPCWVGYGGEWSGPMSEIPQPVVRFYTVTEAQWVEYQNLKRMDT